MAELLYPKPTPSLVRRRVDRARVALLNFRDDVAHYLDGSDFVAIDGALDVLRVFEDFRPHRESTYIRNREMQRERDRQAGYPRTRQRVQRRQSETIGQATKRGERWSTAELDVLARSDLTHLQAALMVGRTYKAVMGKRHNLRAYAAGQDTAP